MSPIYSPQCTEAALLELEAQFHPIRFAAFHLLDLEPEAVPLALFLEVHQSDSQHDRFKRFVRRLTGGRNMDTGFALDEVARLWQEDGNAAFGRIDDFAARQAISTLDLAGCVDLPPLNYPSLFSHVGNPHPVPDCLSLPGITVSQLIRLHQTG